ncbi:splicing factor, proline- and glutamine-rich-like [Rana temporaria]|uniref:splicing factor, proline- and glutamine-rich-like n=1 Tax=Rana temporaria TaxID=8407 RepID=UPI001AADBBD8|nr:splicing factor, proline- and glutamine-rich-like [Rana temporaria]
MEETPRHVPPASPVKLQAVVPPLPAQSDFVEVDLNSPRPPWGVVVPPAGSGDHLLPPQNFYPPGSHNAKVASNPELSKPSAPIRRSHKVETSADPPQPREGPPRGEGRDQTSGGKFTPNI